MAAAPLVIRRHGEFSDWPCTLGDVTYNLHKVVLATGSRCSGFFKGAFNKGFEAAGTDLAVLLPLSCHAYVESALDFVYGSELSFTIESALVLCKIADVLSIDSLTKSAMAAMSALEVKGKHFELALSLELPIQAKEVLLRKVRVEDALEVLAKQPAEPHLGNLLQSCAKKARLISQKDMMDLQPGVKCNTIDVELSVAFLQPGVQRLHRSPISTNQAVCRVRGDKLNVSWSCIGVSRLSASFSPTGFVRGAGWWGLSLVSGDIYAEGAMVCSTGRNHSHFIGQAIQMRMDRPKHVLEFMLEDRDVSKDVALGSISAAFDSWDDLVFTVCAQPGTEYAILQMDV